jgi:hypothetical protein
MDDVQRVMEELSSSGSCVSDELEVLLDEREVGGLRSRAEQMLEKKRFPLLDPDVNVPWPYI